MSYCTRDDLFRQYGTEAVVALADRGAGDDVDQVIETAISEASKRIDAYIAKKVTLPLDQSAISASSLPWACAALAYAWLWAKVGDVSEYAQDQERAAVKHLQDIASDRAAIPGASSATGGSPYAPDIEDMPSDFDWSKY